MLVILLFMVFTFLVYHYYNKSIYLSKNIIKRLSIMNIKQIASIMDKDFDTIEKNLIKRKIVVDSSELTLIEISNINNVKLKKIINVMLKD